MSIVEWVDSEPCPEWLLFLIRLSMPRRSPDGWQTVRTLGWSGLIFGFFALFAFLAAWWIIRFAILVLVTVPAATGWLLYRVVRDRRLRDGLSTR